MHERTLTSTAISSQEVEAELGRILASPTFSKAARHSCFLEFVVRKTLAGSADLIKEYSIGLEVFGRRSEDYDTGLDPGVRSRRDGFGSRLANYYQTDGKLDESAFSCPKAPTFRSSIATGLNHRWRRRQRIQTQPRRWRNRG